MTLGVSQFFYRPLDALLALSAKLLAGECPICIGREGQRFAQTPKICGGSSWKLGFPIPSRRIVKTARDTDSLIILEIPLGFRLVFSVVPFLLSEPHKALKPFYPALIFHTGSMGVFCDRGILSMRRLTGLNGGLWLTKVSAVVSRMIPTSIRSRRPDGDFSRQLFPNIGNGNGKLKRESGSRRGGIGSGPTGFFFSHFLLDMTRRFGIDVGLAPWTRSRRWLAALNQGTTPKACWKLLRACIWGSTSMMAATLRLTDRPAQHVRWHYFRVTG